VLLFFQVNERFLLLALLPFMAKVLLHEVRIADVGTFKSQFPPLREQLSVAPGDAPAVLSVGDAASEWPEIVLAGVVNVIASEQPVAVLQLVIGVEADAGAALAEVISPQKGIDADGFFHTQQIEQIPFSLECRTEIVSVCEAHATDRRLALAEV